MKRDINKLLDEYVTKHGSRRRADIAVSEVNAIIDKANGDLYSALLLCYEVGYTIGHRHGRKAEHGH